MAKDAARSIGDEQLVFGLPKHMSATATGDVDKYMTEQKAQGNVKGEHYWTVHPKPGACEKCRAMAKDIYLEEPQRPHPNCKCVYKKHDIKDPKTAWTFDGTHLCMKGGPCFACVSGGFGKGALPPGLYTILKNVVNIANTKDNQGCCDKHGNCWWLPIEPDFDAGGRGHFGIHPDGRGPGTAGCIGLTDEDTSEAQGFFTNVRGQQILVK